MIQKTIFMIFLVLITLPLITAQPPFQTGDFEQGFIIESPVGSYLENGKNFTIPAHVFNSSSGYPIINSTTSCYLHLYDNNGIHLIRNGLMTFEPPLDFEYEVDGQNITQNGQYEFVVQCNSTNLGGFIRSGFEVTPNGFDFSTSQSILNVVLILASLVLLGVCGWFAVSLKYANETDKEGFITRITKTKYLKLMFVWFSLASLVLFFTTLSSAVNNFLFLDSMVSLVTNFYLFSYYILWALTLPILLIFFVEIWRDIVLNKEILRYGKAALRGN